jgi:hypothetical protein
MPSIGKRLSRPFLLGPVPLELVAGRQREPMTGRWRKAQSLAPFGFLTELEVSETGVRGLFGRMPAFCPILALDRIAPLLGIHPAAPFVTGRVPCQTLRLAHVDREQPLRNVAASPAGAFAKAVQPPVGPLACRPVEILKIAVRIAALILLKPWDGSAPHVSRLRRESSGNSMRCNRILLDLAKGTVLWETWGHVGCGR